MVAKWPKQKNRNERYDGSEMMGKIVWKGEILPGMRDEYFRRHDEIWPEMVTALKESGSRIIPYGTMEMNSSDRM